MPITLYRVRPPVAPNHLSWLIEFLKRTHAFDMPLFLSILKGDLAFVGPEALSSEQCEELQEHDHVRFSVRPGLTDPYTIRRRMNIAFDGRSVPERAYLAERGIRKDLSILARTIPALILGGSVPVRSDSFILQDIDITNVSMHDAIEKLVALSEAGHRHVAFVNPHCFNLSTREADYRDILKRADMVLPDGIGIKIAGKLIGAEVKENVNGTDMFPRLCQYAQEHNKRLFLLGAAPGVSELTRRNMVKRFPGLDIAGAWHGYFEDHSSEEDEIIAAINHVHPDFLLVARGVPGQERWIDRNLSRLDVGVAMGVGGLFDFYSGRIKRAPIWVRELGLEWFWRLAMEPRRMANRYLVGNPLFIMNVWKWYVAQARTQLIKRFDDIDLPSQRLKAEFEFHLRRTLWWIATEGSLKVKRAIDIAGSSTGLLLLTPLFLTTATAIKLEDPSGPVFFKQQRVGRYGKIFTIIKFRSMYTDAEERKAALMHMNETGGVIFKMKHDPRISRVGRVIRRFSIDEMPQLFNVLIGDMSLVGPRPPIPSEVEQYQVLHRDRLEVIPGLTCIWQVSGRSLLNFDSQVLLDRNYIQNRSLLGDLKLILKTIPAVLSGHGAF